MTARPLVPTTRVVRRFPQRENLVLRARDTICTETRVINTEVQFYFLHETLGVICLLVPHGPVVSLAMQLVIHDECLDSECPTA